MVFKKMNRRGYRRVLMGPSFQILFCVDQDSYEDLGNPSCLRWLDIIVDLADI